MRSLSEHLTESLNEANVEAIDQSIKDVNTKLQATVNDANEKVINIKKKQSLKLTALQRRKSELIKRKADAVTKEADKK